MLPENRLVPYSPSPVPKGKLVIFAPHPDDEVIGAGGTILQAQRQGSDITIVYITNGDQGGDAVVRKDESTEVCRRLGAKAIFLGWPDRGFNVDPYRVAIISDVIKFECPDIILAPSPQEFHIDHRATAHLIYRAARRNKFQGGVFYYDVCKQNNSNYLVDISDEIEEKRSLMEVYASQTQQNNYVDVMIAINRSRTYTLESGVDYAESFFKVDDFHYGLDNIYELTNKNCFVQTSPEHFPVISYLVRTKNRKKYLRRALLSIKNQDYHKIEVVVVNDGGDSVESVCSEFQSEFFRFKLVELDTSLGRSGAANIALINATGDYVNFLDDDDELTRRHTIAFLYYLRRHDNVDVLYRGVKVLDSNSEFVKDYNSEFSKGRMMHGNFIPIHGIVFSRKFIDIGCRFDEDLSYFEDWDFWIQISRLADFIHVPEITAIYHMVGNSAASPHMNNQIDMASHIQKVKEKWRSKWTPVEHGLLEQYLINN